MERGIRLTHEELNRIDLMRLKTTLDGRLSQLLDYHDVALRRHDRKHIAERLGCSYETVIRIRREYRERGLDALKPEKPPGRPSRATREYISAMKHAVATNPQDLGYGFSTWSTKRLAAHLKKVTGIGFSDDQLSRLLHRHGYSIQAPQTHDERQTRRGGLSASRRGTRALEKKATGANAFGSLDLSG